MTHKEVLEKMHEGWSLCLGWWFKRPNFHRHTWLQRKPGHGGETMLVGLKSFQKLLRDKSVVLCRVERGTYDSQSRWDPNIWVYQAKRR